MPDLFTNKMNLKLPHYIFISTIVHIILAFVFSAIIIQGGIKQMTLFTEVTLLGGGIPKGVGMGQRGALESRVIPRVAKLVKKSALIPKEVEKSKVAINIPKIVQPVEEKIEKISAVQPVVNNASQENLSTTLGEKASGKGDEKSLGFAEGSSMTEGNTGSIGGGVGEGTGFGDDPGLVGIAEGNPDIQGPIAQRGIRYSYVPPYPELAKKTGAEGDVKIQIVVSPAGFVRYNVKILQTSGYREFDEIVIESIKKWKFEPLPGTVTQLDQQGVIAFKFKIK